MSRLVGVAFLVTHLGRGVGVLLRRRSFLLLAEAGLTGVEALRTSSSGYRR